MNICFSGGGMKGLAYIGVLKYLEEKYIKINRISGTSIGSLMAMLIACGFKSYEIENLAVNINLSFLEDLDITLMFSSYGLDKGDKIIYLLQYLLNFKGFASKITFIELYNKTGVHISFTCCSIESYSQKIFDHILTPDYQVALACKHSMAIPLIWTLSEEKYIDGCFIKNTPMDILPEKNSIGFYFKDYDDGSIITNIQSYMRKLISCGLHKGNSIEIDSLRTKGYKLIEIKSHCSALDISQTNRKSQIDSGYSSCMTSELFKEYFI